MTHQEAFEAMVRSTGGYDDKVDEHQYLSAKTEFAWTYWQAATEYSAKVVKARYMGDGNREDAEVLRCVDAIRKVE